MLRILSGLQTMKTWIYTDLIHREFPADASDRILSRSGFNELEAVTESASLPHHGEHLDISIGQRELETHQFADRDLIPQQDCNPGLADVNGMAANHGAVARIDADVYVEREARRRRRARIDEV